MPRRDRTSRALFLSWILAVVACGGESGSGDTEATSGASSSGAASSSSDATGAEAGTSDASAGSTTASDGGTPGGDTAASACDAWASGEFASCIDSPAYAACGWTPDGVSPVSLTCIEALEVEGGGVCALLDCSDRCDCFAPPASGTATVECLDGVVADHTVCVLYCGGGEQCPDGMVCSVQSCVWPPA